MICKFKHLSIEAPPCIVPSLLVFLSIFLLIITSHFSIRGNIFSSIRLTVWHPHIKRSNERVRVRVLTQTQTDEAYFIPATASTRRREWNPCLISLFFVKVKMFWETMLFWDWIWRIWKGTLKASESVDVLVKWTLSLYICQVAMTVRARGIA